MSASPELQDAISCGTVAPATSDEPPEATMTPPNDQNAPTRRITAKRIAELRGYVRERRQLQETAKAVAQRYQEGSEARDRMLEMLNVGTLKQQQQVVDEQRMIQRSYQRQTIGFWDWFDRAPEWLVLVVLFVASAVVTLLAVVGALYLLGGVL